MLHCGKIADDLSRIRKFFSRSMPRTFRHRHARCLRPLLPASPAPRQAGPSLPGRGHGPQVPRTRSASPPASTRTATTSTDLPPWLGFLEIGTITPRPQPGNPRPRLFRIPEKQAIINRMGFNNEGVDQLIANVKAGKFPENGGILGINIGKNDDADRARRRRLPGLPRQGLCAGQLRHRQHLFARTPRTCANCRRTRRSTRCCAPEGRQQRLSPTARPLRADGAEDRPDLDDAQITAIADLLRRHRMDGVIATNTTISRAGVEGLPNAAEQAASPVPAVRNLDRS